MAKAAVTHAIIIYVGKKAEQPKLSDAVGAVGLAAKHPKQLTLLPCMSFLRQEQRHQG